jgi:hypothetical protein
MMTTGDVDGSVVTAEPPVTAWAWAAAAKEGGVAAGDTAKQQK